MTSLPPHADQVVRDAVDAFMEGRLVPEFLGETVFETKNSRYRLIDGVVVAGPDPSLNGAELVGWFCESGRRCLVESAWQPGSRAVLVDRQRGRDIIVTSTTRLLHLEDTNTSRPARPQAAPAQFRSWHPPPAELPPEPPSPPAPPLEPQQPRVILAATPAPPPAAPRKPAVHLPPRPIAPLPPPAPSPRPVLRPLPLPTPPPRRPSPVPPPPVPPPPVPMVPPPPAPAPETPWEVTSSELQVVDEEAFQRDDAAQQGPGEADSMPSIPIDLVRLLRPRLGDDDPRQ